MSKLKRYSALIALVAAVIVIGVTGSNIYAKKDLGTFYLKDLEGNRDAINDVIISGDLEDGYHKTHFLVNKGQLQTQTEIFEQPQQASRVRFVLGMGKRMMGLEYDVNGDGSEYRIVARKRTSASVIPMGTAVAAPPIYLKRTMVIKNVNTDDEYTSNSFTYMNPLEYGLAAIGDKVYFTVPTTNDYTGNNGIYELNFSDDWGYRAITGDKGKEARTVASINLDRNDRKEAQSSSIEILGLEAVNSKLVLIMVIDNELVIRSYDSESGRILGEAAIPNFFLAGRTFSVGSTEIAPDVNTTGESHSVNYEAYSDHDQNVLNLSFNRIPTNPVPKKQLDKTLLSFDLSDGVRVIEQIQASMTDGEEDTYSGISYMSYRNGKLYMMKTMLSKAEDTTTYLYDIVRPRRFMIYVYEASNLIYKGELMTDMNDDNIRAINITANYGGGGGFGYNQSEYRYYDNLNVK